MKIYDEVVIDMNPESDTFEQTLSEDSYEYSGDVYECGGIGKKIKKGVKKLWKGVKKGVSAIGEVWNRTIGKRGLAGWLGKHTSLGRKIRKGLRKHLPSWIHNMRSMDWAGVLMSAVGPGAVFGKLGSWMNKAGGMWANWASKAPAWLGKGMMGLQKAVELPRTIFQPLLGMGANPNAMYSIGNTAGWASPGTLGFGTSNWAKAASAIGKAGMSKWNPIGQTFKFLYGGQDAMRGKDAATGNLGTTWDGLAPDPTYANQLASGMPNVDYSILPQGGASGLYSPYTNQVANAAAAGAGPIEAGAQALAGEPTQWSNYTTGMSGNNWMSNSPILDTGSWGQNLMKGDSLMGKKLGKYLNYAGTAAQAGAVMGPAMMSEGARNTAMEIGGRIGNELGMLPDEYNYYKGGGIDAQTGDWGEHPGPDAEYDLAEKSKELLNQLNADAMQVAQTGADNVSAIAAQYQDALPGLREGMHQQIFGTGQSPNELMDIAGATEAPALTQVQQAAHSKGRQVASQVRGLQDQWADIMYNPDYGVSDFDYWDELGGAPVKTNPYGDMV